MSDEKSKQAARAALGAAWETMAEELQAWWEAHPEASFDEIANQVTPRRQVLMGKLLASLGGRHGNGFAAEGVRCETCGCELVYKGI